MIPRHREGMLLEAGLGHMQPLGFRVQKGAAPEQMHCHIIAADLHIRRDGMVLRNRVLLRKVMDDWSSV